MDAAPAQLGFWRGLVTGPGGLPDEAAFSYLAAQGIIVAGTIYNTIIGHHFPILDFIGGETALIPLYNAFIGVRGSIGKGQ